MTPDDGLRLLEELIQVTPQRVSIAKAFFLQNFHVDVSTMVASLLVANEVHAPNTIVIHPSVDSEDQIKKAADGISWTLAGCEAVWSLISSGLLIPASYDMRHFIGGISWTTVFAGSGGMSSGWRLDHLSIPTPSTVCMPPSAAFHKPQSLSDPDLFLHTMNISNIHSEVEDSLREAVRCFRHELYLACLAMLGKASEGAWVELGRKLADAVPSDSAVNGAKIKERLEDPNIGIGKKISETMHLYERADVFKSLHKDSGVTIQDLRNVVIWADGVRESRNSVHYGVYPAMPNTYEKVAALMVGAVPHFRMLYKISESLK